MVIKRYSLSILGAAIATLVNCTNDSMQVVNSTNAEPQVSLEETVLEPKPRVSLYQLFAPSLSELLKKEGYGGTIHDASSSGYERKIGDIYLANSKPAYLTLFEGETFRGQATSRGTNTWLVGLVDNEDGTYRIETGAQNKYWNDAEKYLEVKPFVTFIGNLEDVKKALPFIFAWQMNYDNIDKKCQDLWRQYDKPEETRRTEIQRLRIEYFTKLADERNWPGLHLEVEAKKGLIRLAKTFEY